MSTFKRFLQYYKPYKGIFFMDLFCAFIMCIVDLSFPLILSYCTGHFFLKSSNETSDVDNNSLSFSLMLLLFISPM